MFHADKPLAWLHGEIKSPPLSSEARIEDPDAVVICEVFSKKTQATPRNVIASCRRRLAAYDAAAVKR
jgi:hypothetical protein